MTRLIRFYGAVSRIRANKTHIFVFSWFSRSPLAETPHRIAVCHSAFHRGRRSCMQILPDARDSIRKIFLIANLCSHKERHSWFAFISTFCPSAFAFRICTHARFIYSVLFFASFCMQNVCTLHVYLYSICRLSVWANFYHHYDFCAVRTEIRNMFSVRDGNTKAKRRASRCEWGSKCV